MVLAYFGTEYQAMLAMTATLLSLMVAQLGKNEIHEAMASISGTFFGVFYVAWLLSHAVLLRKFDAAAAAHQDPALLVTLGLTPQSGIFLMFFALVPVVLCDAGAYFAAAWRWPAAPRRRRGQPPALRRARFASPEARWAAP